jgi:hypothetical protein
MSRRVRLVDYLAGHAGEGDPVPQVSRKRRCHARSLIAPTQLQTCGPDTAGYLKLVAEGGDLDMSRPERPVDSDQEALAEFARDLRLLREKVGRPGYRELARRANYAPATLSEAAAGRKLPSLAVTLAYVVACEGNPAEWEARWHAVAAELAERERPVRDDPEDSPMPYLGWASYQAGDAVWFAGRERLVSDLLSWLRKQRFLVLSGVSGSGKSSVLRAGVVPRFETSIVLTPGVHPLDECAAKVAQLTGVSALRLHQEMLLDPQALHRALGHVRGEVLIVVDQFEEVFTRCDNEEERAGFIRALLGAAQAQDSRARVVLGIRADFLTQFAVNQLALSEHAGYPVIQLDAMTTEELRRAITRPAARAGCPLDGDLMTELVTDAAHQHGVLPVLSQALLETWKRRHGPRLTLAAYQATGGIQGLLAQAAEAVYTALSPYDQRAAKALILRMVALGDATNRVELDQYVLGKLAAARVVVLGAGSAGLAHESLMQYWSRLRGWLAEEADGLRIHRQLADAAEAWEALDRDRDALYRGGRLTEAHSWAATRKLWLTAREQEFLHVSLAVQAREVVEARRRSRRLQRVFGSWVAP